MKEQIARQRKVFEEFELSSEEITEVFNLLDSLMAGGVKKELTCSDPVTVAAVSILEEGVYIDRDGRDWDFSGELFLNRGVYVIVW